jgi:hypothetical protein
VVPTFLISPGRLGPGSTRPFSWYFEGTSTVNVGNIEEVLQWLAGCTYARDIDLFHEPDYWQHPTTFEHLRRGDCEDHALWAWRNLVELGVKADFFIGQLKPESDRSGHHAWVVYERENVRYLLETLVVLARGRARAARQIQDVTPSGLTRACGRCAIRQTDRRRCHQEGRCSSIDPSQSYQRTASHCA